jgi:hypothetical protein
LFFFVLNSFVLIRLSETPQVAELVHTLAKRVSIAIVVRRIGIFPNHGALTFNFKSLRSMK